MLKIKKIWRGFLTLFSLALFGCGALFVRYLIFPFGKTKADNYVTLQKTWTLYLNIISGLGIIDLKYEDIDRIKNIKNSIIVSNHPSLLDIVILMSVIPNSTCFVADKLAKNFFLKGMVKHLFIIEGSDDWLEETCKKIDEGMNIIVFPMGGRHKKDQRPRIHRGASLIAYKSHKDIYVLHIYNSFEFLQKGVPAYESDYKVIDYNVSYVDKINTQEFLDKYNDEITFKTEVTKFIASKIYKSEN